MANRRSMFTLLAALESSSIPVCPANAKILMCSTVKGASTLSRLSGRRGSVLSVIHDVKLQLLTTFMQDICKKVEMAAVQGHIIAGHPNV